MSSVAFVFIAILTLAAALAAVTLRRLIHAALMLALSFLGLAAFYFFVGAEFVGLVQIFVYVGAVAILIVFTILLTRRETETTKPLHWFAGGAIALLVFVALAWAISQSPALAVSASPRPSISVKQIGETLMTGYVWPLLCLGLLLTAALIGALVLVMEEKR